MGKGQHLLLGNIEYKIEIEPNIAPQLIGKLEENIRLIEEGLKVAIFSRGNEINFTGEQTQIDKGVAIIQILNEQLKKGNAASLDEIRYLVHLAQENQLNKAASLTEEVVAVTARGKKIFPRTIGQKQYVESILGNGLTFGIGPAGTGKTYLAVALAVAALQAKSVNRLILTRPAVEAGEKLGFLPGDLQEKVDPYLRPLYDALYDVMGVDLFQKYLERGIIEIAPLAYMRGRTLDDAFIILDEAQNTTPEQMKMFLTRMGFGSKAVVTGDITQVDLPKGTISGLTEVGDIFTGVPGISVVMLTDHDVVRHELVQRIIRAYERYQHTVNHKGAGNLGAQ
ncbi:MAG TPA: phosphate starvation-inducible protein PhoH [Firmicutes bacterium]|jgi:phosphate starvation-inducible protein PhoH and related proteins|nr:phosphate starvation-inducible protein PhoH [Bacillota bacterium]